MPERPFETQAVTNLQRYLLQLSYFDDRIPPVPIDGIFDTATKDALMAFQRVAGLPATGRGDAATWDALYLAYLESLATSGRPEPIYLFPRFPETYSVGVGDEGLLIAAIRYLLRELMIDYGGEFEDIPLLGTYDTVTQGAVQKFQALRGLPVTGRVDRATWNALAQALEFEQNRYPRQ